MLYTYGYTTDGKRVVAGLFRFYETHGLPLDVVIEIIRERDCIPAWIPLLHEMLAAGMNRERALSKISESIADTYGSEYRDVVMKRLEAE